MKNISTVEPQIENHYAYKKNMYHQKAKQDFKNVYLSNSALKTPMRSIKPAPLKVS